MEDYQERSWISDDPPKRVRYDQHRILPSKVIAEYCLDEVWVSYNEANTIELPPSPIAYDGSNVKWVASNTKRLYRLYPDQWILVEKGHVIASSADPNALFPIAEGKGIEAPFITRVVRPTKRNTMIYAK